MNIEERLSELWKQVQAGVPGAIEKYWNLHGQLPSGYGFPSGRSPQGDRAMRDAMEEIYRQNWRDLQAKLGKM